MAIVVLLLWLATAAVGFTMLRAGGAARRAAAARAGTPRADALQAASAAGTRLTPGPRRRSAAVPLAADGSPPPVPNTRVVTPPGEHPLLEFSHPTLAITGLATWTMFVLVHYQPLAWTAFGIWLAAMGAGLGWLDRTRRDRARKVTAAWAFPPRLVRLHGLAALLSIALTVLTALSAAHG